MKLPAHIFALSKSEQCVVLFILIALLGGTIAKRYHDQSLRPPPVPVPTSATPVASPPEDDESR